MCEVAKEKQRSMAQSARLLVYLGCLEMLQVMAAGPHQESFTGNISTSDNRTWIQELFLTAAPLTTVIIQFEFRVQLKGDRCNPVIYLRHEHQQGYGSTQGCFSLGEHQFFRAFDVRLLRPGYEDGGCQTVGNTGVCLSNMSIANGYPVRRTVSVGYRCEEDCASQYLELDYAVVITDIPQPPCQRFQPEEIKGDYDNVKVIVELCQAIYPTYSNIGLFGMDIERLNLMFTSGNAVFESRCYQHLYEITCRSMFPECRLGNNASFAALPSQVVYPCRDMCEQMMEACEGLIRQEVFPIECNTMQYRANDTGCINREVQCPVPSDDFPHGEVAVPSLPLGHGSTLRYSCRGSYILNSSAERTCQLSGEWLNDEPVCIFPEFIIITVSVLGAVVLILALAGLVHHYWLEIKVLLVNRCQCGRHAKKCSDIKAFHAFLCFAEEDMDQFVRPLLCELEDKAGYRLCVHHRNFLPGEYILENILTAIAESYRVVVVLSRAYLRSNYCLFEFEQAYLRSVSNPLFRLVVVLVESPQDLDGLEIPPLMRAHLRTHTYISECDTLFLEKLKAVLPRYLVRPAYGNGPLLVRGGCADIVQDRGSVVESV